MFCIEVAHQQNRQRRVGSRDEVDCVKDVPHGVFAGVVRRWDVSDAEEEGGAFGWTDAMPEDSSGVDMMGMRGSG